MHTMINMKTKFTLLTFTMAFSLLDAVALRGQEPKNAGTSQSIQAAGDKLQPAAKQLQGQTRQEIGIAQEQAQIARRNVEQAHKQLAQAVPAARPIYADRLQNVIRRAPGGSAKTLVIRSAESDSKGQANLEEDLSVMSHIFDKAVDEKLGADWHARNAMGINVFFAPGSSQLRNLYLDGYGALFLLHVSFPLLPPPAKPEPEKEKAPVDSAWQEAKDELYGQHSVGKTVVGPVEEYNEEKVNKLRDALLEALKNASNIRNLKADDSITVCVFGGGSPSAGKFRAATGQGNKLVLSPGVVEPATGLPAGHPGAVDSATGLPAGHPGGTDPATGLRTGHGAVDPTTGLPAASGTSQAEAAFQSRYPGANGWGLAQVNDPGVRGSIMTIRVKKSDVDAFAKGKLNADEFRKKAKSATYAADVGSGSGNFSFNFSGGDGVFDIPSRTLRTPDQLHQPLSPHGSGGGGFGEAP